MGVCPRGNEHDYQYQDSGHLAGYLVCTKCGRVSRCPEDGEHDYQFQDDGWPICTKCGDQEQRHMDRRTRDALVKELREQGLPFHVEDKVILARVAALLDDVLKQHRP